MSFEIKKIYTDNPFVDEMVYYSRLMGIETTLKMQAVADRNETVDSLKASGLYIACIEGTANFRIFENFSYNAIKSAGVADPKLIAHYMRNKANIPLDKRDAIVAAQRREYIENYVELNPYYRMLHGEPPIGHVDYTDWVPPDGVIIDVTKPIHEMDISEASILDRYGILDRMIDEDPVNRLYMRHLGNKKIDYYLARKAGRFDPLYMPTIESDAIENMFKDKLNDNKWYVLRTIYSEAYNYNSDYYDNFIAVLIIVITVIDIIARVQEFIARKEIFDIRSIQYIFKSYGVPFYENIPFKYQLAMVKNLHTLLKYKSTAKCMVDICSLFGFNNIKIFKYYLLRDRRINLATEEYKYVLDDDGNEDLGAEYELKFLKLPLDEDLDDYIRSGGNYVDYDEITYADPKWDGQLDHDMVMKDVLKEEFNFARTKYISIDSMYDIAKMSMQQTYFFNFLFDNSELETLLTLKVPFIEPGREFNVSDLFTLLTVLNYYYRGVKDTLMDTQSKVLYVNGFNFKADLATLAEAIGPKKINGIVVDPGSTLHAQEQLAKFIIPKSSITSFGEMMEIYINNMEVMEELIKGMREADDKKVYDVYRKLYDSLCIVELTLDHYKNPETGDFYRDSEGDATYTEYLKHRDSSLYYIIELINEFEDDASRNQYIANVIDSITYALEEFIDSDMLNNIVNGLPVMGIESVKGYIAMVINFYKSYKVDFLGLNTIYTFDDKDEDGIVLIDGAKFNRFWIKEEILHIVDKIKTHVEMSKKEQVELIERIYMDIFTWGDRYLETTVNIRDQIDIISRLVLYTIELMEDEVVGMDLFARQYESITVADAANVNSNLELLEFNPIRETVWIYSTYEEPSKDEYMDFVDPYDYNKIILADKEGNSKAGPYIVGTLSNKNRKDVVTEKVVDSYVESSNVVFRRELSQVIDTANPSDTTILSEKSVVQALSPKDTI